jgi:N-acetylglucosaminyl-diphospho-decaprenol L-rhamnosyltransferase
MEPQFVEPNVNASERVKPASASAVEDCLDVQAIGKPPPMHSTLLSILVLTHNHEKFLAGCLDSIQRYVSCPFEVILVDNASQEPSDSLTARYPWLRVIRSEKNLGFNAGNNLAARNANGEHLLLLNVDTVLLSDVVPAIALLRSDLKIGAVGAEAHGVAGEIRPSAGRFPKAHRLWLFRNLWMKPKISLGPSQLRAFKVDWVEGSFLVTTLELWNAVGGFDEKNFLYGNDVEFCRSASDRGLAVVQCTATKYIHFGGYEVSRVGQLYAAFRAYHRKFSTPLEQRMADLVMRAGLIARILVYGLWFRATKNKKIGEKYQRFVEVRRNWAHLTA